MSHAALMACYANPMRVCDSADFDGTNDVLQLQAGLTGAVDSSKGIFSCWVRVDGGNATTLDILSGATTLDGGVLRCEIARTVLNKFEIVGTRPTDGVVLRILSNQTYVASATWRHVLISWDITSVSEFWMAINDIHDEDATSGSVPGEVVDLTLADWSIGGAPAGDLKFNGCLADLYFAPGQYLDFSRVANRRKFISASGKPVHLGTTGSLPTGTAPLVYQHLDDAEAVASFATNRGTGGNFTITGTLDTGSTSPSD